jgi:hypothetical protein
MPTSKVSREDVWLVGVRRLFLIQVWVAGPWQAPEEMTMSGHVFVIRCVLGATVEGSLLGKALRISRAQLGDIGAGDLVQTKA